MLTLGVNRNWDYGRRQCGSYMRERERDENQNYLYAYVYCSLFINLNCAFICEEND